jgi:hypothetical protein
MCLTDKCYCLPHCFINPSGRPRPVIFPLGSFSHDISTFRSMLCIVCCYIHYSFYSSLVRAILMLRQSSNFKWFWRLMNETSNGVMVNDTVEGNINTQMRLGII